MSDRPKSWPWLLALAAVVAIFFHDSLLGGRSLVPTDILHQLLLPESANVTNVSVVSHFASDALTIDYPWGVFWQATVRQGQLPLWDPYILGGHAHFAESMPAVLSPFKIFYLFLSAERAFTFGIIAQFFLAAFAMFACLREFGRSPAASSLGACAWTLNSAFLLWYWRVPAAMAWAPLVILFIERSIQRRSTGAAAIAGLVFALSVLSGNVQAAAHLGFLCAAWGLFHLWNAAPADRRAIAARLGTFAVVGMLASAVQWMPTLELMARDVYGSTGVRGGHWSLRHTVGGLAGLITLLFPAVTGSGESYDLLKFAEASRADFAGYLGIVPVTLAIIAATASRDRRTRWWLGIVMAVIVILFGTPLIKYLYHRFLIVAVFAGAVLAADGADLLLNPSDANRRQIRRAIGGMVVFGGLIAVGVVIIQIVVTWHYDTLMEAAQRMIHLGGGYAFSYKTMWFQERLATFFNHYKLSNVEFWVPLGCLAGAAIVASRWLGRNTGRNVLIGALAILTVVDLTVLGRRVVPQIDLERYPLHPIHATLEPLLADHDLFRFQCAGTRGVYTYRSNWLLGYGLADIAGSFSLGAEGTDWLIKHAPDAHASNTVLNLANVKYIFAEPADVLPYDHLELLVERDGLRTYRNNACLPRVQFISQWEAIPDRAELLKRLWSPTFDPSATILLEQAPPGPSHLTATYSLVEMLEYTPLWVRVRVRTDQPGLLLLGDSSYPGWEAWLDTQRTTLYRADGIFRAVSVPAGEHTVLFEYAPRAFRYGAIVSVLTLLGCGVLLRKRAA